MTDHTALLRELFASVLDVDLSDVDDDADFFLYGGHSLSAATLASAIEEACHVEVATLDVFEHPTPALLAEHLVGRTATASTPTSAEDLRAPGSSVSAETAWLWMERQRDAATGSAYTVPCLLSVDGEVRVDRLRSAVASLLAAHPALRTTFVEHLGAPRVVVSEPDPDQVLSIVEVPAVDGAIDRIVTEHVETPFDPATGALFRVAALRDGSDWSLLLTADHLVCDGRSLDILAADLAAAYDDLEALRANVSVPSAPETSARNSLDHWRTVLDPPPPPLPLPITAPRRGPVGDTGTAEVRLGPALTAAFRDRARAARVGPFAPMAAGVMKALSELTGVEDVCVGTAVDRRARNGSPRTVGFHVATIPLRVRLSSGDTSAEVVGAVARAAIEGVDHSDVPFADVVAELDPPRTAWRNPYFDVWVAVYPWVDTGPSSGIRLRGGPVPLRQGLFELSFQFVEKGDGDTVLTLQYDRLRYDDAAARRLVDRVVTALRWVVDEAPSVPAPAASSAPAFSGFRFG